MSVRLTRRRSLRALCSLAVAGTLLLAACGGGGDSSGGGSAVAGNPVIPVLSAASGTASVVLPAGVALSPDKLTVQSSIAQATPDASGAFTISSYVDGEQLAIVLSPAGNPMLMGWIDATHTTISAATTAQVLAYFALNGSLMLNDAERQALMADLPSAPGIDAVTAAVQSELALNVDAFASADPVLTQALAAFANSTYASAQASAVTSRAHAQGIVINPATQSGIDVLQDPPFAAHLTNSFRRRAWAFVDRVSHTTGGVDVADPLAVTNFEVPPVIGVNGGVTGALTDIMSAYYGNQPTAYASITAPDSGSFAVPLVDGSDKTTYQVTVVGPGPFAGVSAGLTAAQSAQLTEVTMRGFVKDFIVPTLANAVLGSGAIDFTKGTGDKAKFMADVLTNLTADFISYAASVPDLNDKIAKGQWFDAGVAITGTVGGSGALRTMLIKGFEVAVANRAAAGLDTGPMQGLLKSFNNIMNAAGGVLQVFDSGDYLTDLGRSDRADQWSLVVTPQKIALNPPTSNIGVGGTVVMTASVLGADDTSGYSYGWTTTSNFGDLNEIGGNGRVHQTAFYCSSSNEALFVYETPAAPGTSDTVTVQVYSGPNCDPAKGQLLGSAPATITFGITTVNIALTQQWTDTGLAVVAGQQLTITTTGTMDYWTGGCPSTQNCVVTPDGLPWSVCEGSNAGPYLAPGLQCFSLIGRFGANGTPFEVGSNLTVTVPATASGEFYLGVNDNNYPDNTGSWVSTIK
jgi:hypothetical protein